MIWSLLSKIISRLYKTLHRLDTIITPIRILDIQHGNPTKKTHSTRKKGSLSDKADTSQSDTLYTSPKRKYLSSDNGDISQSASTHYTHLSGDTSAEPNISTASSQPVMIGPDSLEHIEGHDVGKRNKPIYGPRRKHQSRRRSRY